VAELVQNGQIDEQTACQHPALMIAGLVGSIDNDMVGTDMTIGADSALYRITEGDRRHRQHRRQSSAQLRQSRSWAAIADIWR
jgi:6-phosphofructokinase